MSRRILLIPQFNEALTIIQVLEAAAPYVDRIIVVNDGSRDRSGELIAHWTLEHQQTVLLSLEDNQGKAGALLCGFAYLFNLLEKGLVSPEDLVINIDADGQHRAEEIPLLCTRLEEGGFDVVTGRRDLTWYPWFKHVGNWGLSLWASLLTGYRYHDVECGLRAMRLKVLPALLTYFLGRRYSCDQEIGVITAALGLKVENRFRAGIHYYRPGARIRDGVTNLVMGLLAATRVWLGLRYRPSERVRSILSQVTPIGTNAGDGMAAG